MKILGLNFGRKREVEALRQEVRALRKLFNPAGHWTRIFDTYPGQWQQDTDIEFDTVLTFAAVFACIRLISSDIGKMRIKLMERLESGIWGEVSNPAFSPVLRKPNATQTRIKFIEQWVISKLEYGNAYVLKYRDNRNVVVALRVLDPTRVQALVSDSGAVFYRLSLYPMAGLTEEITVPAREIIHDVHVTPEHPLIGVSPIGACGLAASQGINIQKNSQKFFKNRSLPGGMLTAPGNISDDTAARLKASFETNFSGDNVGKLAVAGDGLEFKPFSQNASDSQLIEQLNWTAIDVCRAFGVPPYKIGVGQMPAYNNIEALDQAYYSQTLQELIECIELLLDEGLGLGERYKTHFDLDGLLRMDSMTRAKVMTEQIKAGILAPNEGRAKENLPPVAGGESPYLQQQNYSLAALAKRDASDDPFKTSQSSPAPSEEQPDEEEEIAEEERERMLLADIQRDIAA